MDQATSSSRPMTIDLRALVMAGVVVTPLDLWSLADFVNSYAAWAPTGQIIFETAFEALELLLTSVGLVVVSLGGALVIQRRRVEPIAFTMTSLAVVTPLVAVDATLFSLSMMTREMSADPNASYYVVTEIVRWTANIAMVALAARFYAARSSTRSDAWEGRRAIALSVVVVVLATASMLNWISLLLTIVGQVPISVPLAILQGVQQLLWSLVSAAGPVFLLGLVAIQAVRSRKRERSVGALVFAGSCAAVVYVLLIYGRGLSPYLAHDASLLSLAHAAFDYNPLIGASFAGVGGAIIYGFATNGAALVERLRALPSDILSVRNRPLYAPDEDVER